MPYSVSFHKENGYVRVNAEGVARRGHETRDARDAWTQVADWCHANDSYRILAVWNVHGPLPVLVVYEVASQPQTLHWDMQFRLAVVQLDPDRYRNSQFAETVAVNRGYQVKVFDNEEEALSWLLETHAIAT